MTELAPTTAPDTAGTLPASWQRRWTADPQVAVLVDGASGEVMTAAQLEHASRRQAEHLLALGLLPGDRVLWSPGAPVEACISAVAVLRAGLVLVPANPELMAPELRHVIGEIRPAACLSGDETFRRTLRQIDGALAIVEATAGTRDRDAEGPAATKANLDAAGAADLALILFTSGTTGKPKGAAHTHASLLANAESLRQAWRWLPEDRLVHALPLFHAHGLCVGLFGTLHAGASAVFLRRFGADEVLDAVRRFDASLLFAVPTMYHRLQQSGRAAELAMLRLAVSGSAGLPAQLHESIAAVSGTSILERYGTTETLMSLSNPYEGDRRAGTVGIPLPGVEIRLAGNAGASGELLVRGPSLFSGYFGLPEATAEAFDDGWYRTGDIASVDKDGYVTILGRMKELVISGGFNVYPAEVERVLAEHPGVEEVAVTGTPSQEWGEVVTAWIVPAGVPEPDLATAVSEFGAERLAPYKRPRIIHLVEALPRNPLGKVLKHQLGAPG
jgi:malonyl-CoA/methylmalonyl-CoA synthetase